MAEPHLRLDPSSSLASEEGSQSTVSRGEQSSMISCQASPVAERKSTRTACENDWKLLLREIADSDSSLSRAILPNTYDTRNIIKNLNFDLHQKRFQNIAIGKICSLPASRLLRK
jgi:hypothetical protein